tara:strand:- start:912 stop:1550 length:639 start_codon:yes stop_codon:yes gene_type:complete
VLATIGSGALLDLLRLSHVGCQQAEARGGAGKEEAGAEGSQKEELAADRAEVAPSSDEPAASESAPTVAEQQGAKSEKSEEKSDEKSVEKSVEKCRQRKVRMVTKPELSAWVGSGFSSLLMATREPPFVLLEALMGLLRPGASFAIYHQCIEPLAKCLHLCQNRRCALRLQIVESWTRLYQVDPGRTHPHMTTHPATGYLFVGVKVGNGDTQ